ncbi:MAG: asparagine synthase (glutamine-hydrolyzing) [Magnetococcales bacterium]|nr:asparagine synthase (glutamine-hydrolyzing) [Magnetococcales bacterium]
MAGKRDDALLAAMMGSIVHRGPDDQGAFQSPAISLAMQRLSIIDLAGGKQPVSDKSGKVVLVFNGEIYNFPELRDRLLACGHVLRGLSDTETLLHAYLEWGWDALPQLNGMFAFAIADFRNGAKLHLVRDHVGIKPLYVCRRQGSLLFASEMKAILCDATVAREIHPASLAAFLRFRYVPGETSLIKGIEKLPAGHLLTWEGGEVRMQRWYTPPRRVVGGRRDLSDGAVEAAFAESLSEAVRRQTIADVPLGCYLSGGLDSAVLAALMVRHQGQVNSFSVGFHSDRDETPQARWSAERIGTRHHEIYCTEKDFSLLERLVWHLDEPIGDAIVIPMYLLAREAKQHVKVVLSGEGADEVLGGYLFHKTVLAAVRAREYVPGFLRKGGIGLLQALPHRLLNRLFSYPASLGVEGKARLVRFAREADSAPVEDLYRRLIYLFEPEEASAIFQPDFLSALAADGAVRGASGGEGSVVERLVHVQYRDWLPDNILMKLDKMTMAASLEGRVPYLDREFIEFSMGIPDHLKIRGWREKVILRRLLGKLGLQELVDRRKMPFFIPVDRFFASETFRGLYAQFREENHLTRFIRPDFMARFSLADCSMMGSKRLIALIILNLWMKVFVPDGAGRSLG